MTGIYIDSLGQLYFFSLHFSGVGGELVITGHVTKAATGRTGKIAGEVTALPEIVLGGPSCTNKTQVNFTLVGETTIVIPTV